MEKKFEFLDHTADIKFKAYGKTINEVIENCAAAFSSYIANEQKIKPAKGKIIDVRGDDKESLLYNFLDELIYLIDAENFIVTKASVTVRGYNLHAELYGDDASKYSLKQVKAATYAEMYIKQDLKGWEAQVVLDV